MLEVKQFLIVQSIINVPVVQVLLEHHKHDSQQFAGCSTDRLAGSFGGFFAGVAICEGRLRLSNQRQVCIPMKSSSVPKQVGSWLFLEVQ